MPKHFIMGKEEWCSLPLLGLPAVKARVDTGAKTSSLHAFNIHIVDEDGIRYAKFDIHPIQNNRTIVKSCKAPLVEHRRVKSSSGDRENRPVVRTLLRMDEKEWEIEVTLTNRDAMGYRMLLGRSALDGRALIDPSASFKFTQLSDQEARKAYQASIRRTKKGLHIVLLASNPDLYSNKRIIEAAEQRGHDIRFINVKYSYMNISSTQPEVHYRGGEVLRDVDAVIPRIKPSMTFYGCAVTRQFESMGAFCLNDSVSISRSRDKLRSLQMLSKESIDMPITSFAHSPQDTNHIIKMVGGAPLVVKLLEGTQGRGVVLASTNKAAESVINAFKSLQANILVQEFIKEAEGRDIRCFVVDGKVVGAIQRQAMEGEFRANLHLGGKATVVKITPQERKIAVQAAKVMGLKVAGVDIIRSKHGPKVLEINSSPGLEGIETITGKDIAGMMIECVERYAVSGD